MIMLSQPQSISTYGQYQITLLSDRGTCVWTTCPESLHESGTAESQTCDLLSLLRHATLDDLKYNDNLYDN